ncbi:hypothetical protein [Wolbachia endosymbiont (group A) of Conops quadrifasciatus]|uniref:hypothetical protein n=1 Tax=Wolbachia endosymbiont (group A) of Conops quadrifasciatus TaxID=3066143 RepID=UPI003133012E
MAEYGGVDKRYLISQAGLACCCLIVASATLFSIASPWCYVPTAVFALAACFFIKNAVYAAFFAKTKEPSPDFDEVNAEQVTNSQGQGAAGSSRNVSA